jgi:hypothetical protein
MKKRLANKGPSPHRGHLSRTPLLKIRPISRMPMSCEILLVLILPQEGTVW